MTTGEEEERDRHRNRQNDVGKDKSKHKGNCHPGPEGDTVGDRSGS